MFRFGLILWESGRHFFKNEQKGEHVYCCLGNRVTLSIFAIKQLLRGNMINISKSNHRNFSAYTMTWAIPEENLVTVVI